MIQSIVKVKTIFNASNLTSLYKHEIKITITLKLLAKYFGYINFI